MKLKHRCFSGKTFRPAPTALLHENLPFFAIVTPWGPVEQLKLLLDFLIQNYESFCSDEEKTNIYPPLHSLSEEENVLRALVLSCNEQVFREQNSEGLCRFGYELVCGHFKNGKLVFLQAGQPFIYLDRQDCPVQALGHVLDLSGLLSTESKRLPPLPSSLIGIYPDTHFSVFSLPMTKDDRLIFISRDFAPAALLTTPRQKRNMEDMASLLVKEGAESPFWLGILSL